MTNVLRAIAVRRVLGMWRRTLGCADDERPTAHNEPMASPHKIRIEPVVKIDHARVKRSTEQSWHGIRWHIIRSHPQHETSIERRHHFLRRGSGLLGGAP